MPDRPQKDRRTALSSGLSVFARSRRINPARGLVELLESRTLLTGVSGITNFQTQALAPNAPSQVSAWTQSPTHTNVSWTDNSSDETGFKIERSTNNINFTQIGIAPANATNFVDTIGTVAGTDYQYRVRATNGNGDSGYSPSALALSTPAHVLVVIEENESVSSVVDNINAPYINSLIAGGAYFSAYNSITHPSQPNYLALFSGSTQGVVDDELLPSQLPGPDLGSQIIAAGKSFTGYSEDLPAVGSLDEKAGAIDPYGSPVYARKHNPWSDFSDLPSSTNQPFTAFPADFSQLPTLSFVVPNLMNDMHDGTVHQGDTWLQNNLGTYAQWAKTHNSLLVVTWDEDDGTSSANVIPTIIYGQGVQPGRYSESTGPYGLLRTIEDMYGLSRLGGAASAAPMQDIWPTLSSPVLPASPGNLQATTISSSQINLTWTDNSNNETGFLVERSTSAAGGWIALTPTLAADATSFSDTTGLFPGTQYFYRIRATNAAGASIYSASASADTLAASSFNYILPGSTWKYLDDGSNQATAWETSAFDDSAWKSGPAQLGYGDGDEATVVGYGPDPNHKYITTYFRKTFNVSDPAQVSALNLQLLRDDGAVVYLNGTEVFRSNMPAGAISYTTLASTNVNGTDESTFFPGTASSSLLVAGTNVIAVEIHQSVPDSTDLSFDFSLTGIPSFAYMNGPELNVEFDGTNTPITLGASDGSITATKGATTLTFGGVASINAIGTTANDNLQIKGSIAPPLTFTAGAGNDSVHVLAGSCTFAGDLSPALRNVAVTVDPGASATFASAQHLANLVINGAASLAAGGGNVLLTNALTVTGKFDLHDNALFLDYSGARVVGTAFGGVYSGVTGLVQSGRNGGAWNGNGITTSTSAAAGAKALTTLGVAESSDVLGISGAQTALWNGQKVDATTVLVKYTYLGDANLDGIINGDDYFAIDSHVTQNGSVFGWANGDFNYDGKINGDDYFVIDSTINQRGTPLATKNPPALNPVANSLISNNDLPGELLPPTNDWAVFTTDEQTLSPVDQVFPTV